jgi:hypothetical protein
MPYNVSDTECEFLSTAMKTVTQKAIAKSVITNPIAETGTYIHPDFLNQLAVMSFVFKKYSTFLILIIKSFNYAEHNYHLTFLQINAWCCSLPGSGHIFRFPPVQKNINDRQYSYRVKDGNTYKPCQMVISC